MGKPIYTITELPENIIMRNAREESSVKKEVISVLSALVGVVMGVGAVGKVHMDQTSRIQSMSDKHLALFLMKNQWVKIKQEGKNLSE